LEAYHALKKLESEGFIQFNESYSNPSRFGFNVDKRRLYEFQIANGNYDPLIKALLRIYGGELMGGMVKIQESQLAKALEWKPEEVKLMLKQMNKLQLAVYEPRQESPQVTFLTPRYEAAKLPVNVKTYNQRREIELKKMEAVINYIKNDYRCRTQLILEYFDEVSYEKCGICDNCLKMEKAVITDRETLANQILAVIEEGNTITVQELVQKINSDKELIIEVVRELLDSGQLVYTREHHLKRNR
jgi:ATP-dependent DNA helicase RecQ